MQSGKKTWVGGLGLFLKVPVWIERRARFKRSVEMSRGKLSLVQMQARIENARQRRSEALERLDAARVEFDEASDQLEALELEILIERRVQEMPPEVQ
jgi:hypothetical protein